MFTNRKNRRRNNRSLTLEGLNSRTMLAGQVVIDASDNLTFTDDPGASRVIVWEAKGGTMIRDNNVFLGPFVYTGSTFFHLEDGNDNFSVAGNLPVVATGGPGNDQLRGGNGSDSLEGGLGNDLIGGGNGDNWISGGEGNDKLWARSGNDNIFGGPGNDTIIAGAGNDTIIAGAGRDRVAAGAGDDTVFADANATQPDGNRDFVRGGRGLDECTGEETDVLRCEGIVVTQPTPITFEIGMNHVPGDTHSLFESNVVLAEYVFDLDGGGNTAEVGSLTAGVRVSDLGRDLPGNAGDYIAGLNARNTVTGEVETFIRVSDGPDLVLFQSNPAWLVQDLSHWEFRVNPVNNGRTFDARVSVCASDFNTSETCTFTGILPATSQFNAEVYDHDSGRLAEIVNPSSGHVNGDLHLFRYPSSDVAERGGAMFDEVTVNEEFVGWRGEFLARHVDQCVSDIVVTATGNIDTTSSAELYFDFDFDGDAETHVASGVRMIDGFSFPSSVIPGGCVVIAEQQQTVAEIHMTSSSVAPAAPDNTVRFQVQNYISQELDTFTNVSTTVFFDRQTDFTVVPNGRVEVTTEGPIPSQAISLGTTSVPLFLQDALQLTEDGVVQYVGIDLPGISASVESVWVRIDGQMYTGTRAAANPGDDFAISGNGQILFSERSVLFEYGVTLFGPGQGGNLGEAFTMIIDNIQIRGRNSGVLLPVDIESHVSAQHFTALQVPVLPAPLADKVFADVDDLLRV